MRSLVFLLLTATFVQAGKPNILWLVGENLTHDLGCYGAKDVHTPHLDRLASEGVRYTRVFATNPACAPSRSGQPFCLWRRPTPPHHGTLSIGGVPTPPALCTKQNASH